MNNYGVATQAEAEAGTATNKLMTPERTKQAIEKLAGANGAATKILYEERAQASAVTYSFKLLGQDLSGNWLPFFPDSKKD